MIGGMLAAGRAAAEALMVDTCTIVRDPGPGTFNPDTGGYTDAADTAVYTGPCRVQLRALDAQTADFGGEAVALTRVQVLLPMTATGIAVEDLVTITQSAYDADLTGRTFRVEAVAAKTHATTRRLDCEQIRSPRTP